MIYLLNKDKIKNKNKQYKIDCLNYIISSIDSFNPVNENMIEGSEIYDLSNISDNKCNNEDDFSQIINLLNQYLITNKKHSLDYARMYLVQIRSIIEINNNNF